MLWPGCAATNLIMPFQLALLPFHLRGQNELYCFNMRGTSRGGIGSTFLSFQEVFSFSLSTFVFYEFIFWINEGLDVHVSHQRCLNHLLEVLDRYAQL